MTRSHKFILILSMLVGFALQGCAGFGKLSEDPRTSYVQTQDVYITAVQTLTSGYQLGVFSDKEWETIKDYIREANDLLDEMDQVTAHGHSGIGARDSILSILDKLKPYIGRAEAAGAKGGG